MKKLTREFFALDTLTVAKALLGKVLVYHNIKAMITETEAYHGFDDPASHAARGMTPRNQIMYKKPGLAYVYLTYGMHHCLNFVTEKEDYPSAVLIRALQLIDKPYIEINGPGRLTKYLGITRLDNEVDIVTSPNFYVACQQKILKFNPSVRIGIKLGLDKMWRFKAVLN